jgi:hypothetical protein
VLLKRRLGLAQELCRGLQRHLGARQLVAALARPRGVLEHARDASAVLAHQPLDLRQALFYAVERERLPGVAAQLGLLAVGAQAARQIAGLDRQRAEALGHLIQTRIDAGKSLQRCVGGAEQRRDARRLPLVGGQRLRAGHRRRAQGVQAAHPLARREQLIVLALVGSRRVDLGELELEQVKLALARAGELAQLRHPLMQAPALGEGLRAGAQPAQLLGPTQLVQECQLLARDGQLAVLVLSVEGHQRGADVAQV